MATATASPTKFTAESALALHQKAYAAGMVALEQATPTPMVWGKPSTPLGSDVAVPMGVVYEGACGYAWVTSPATSSFARQMLKAGLWRRFQYEGGAGVWVREGGQSYERKCAFARAYAGVLVEAGIKAYVGGRMD